MIRLVSAMILLFGLCGVSHAGPMDVFLNFFNRNKAIQTQKGKVVTVERTLASLAFPMKFTIEGELPQGEVDCFAMVGYKEKLTAMSQPASSNPFDKTSWKPDFFPWHTGDRIVPYKTITHTGNKLLFDGYSPLLKEHFISNRIFTLLFAVAPKGKVQKWKLGKAHIVSVVLK